MMESIEGKALMNPEALEAKDTPQIYEQGSEKGKRTSIGVNLRVTGHCQQGGRKYMEDYFAVAYQQTDDEKDLEYAFFGIFDGHGGAEAAAFAKEHLMEFIVKDPRFWFEDDVDVMKAIKDGFIDTHRAMWKIHDKWPKTASGLPSTAGTTASIAFIRRGKIYIGHVGDSGITLGYQNPGCPDWQAQPLTKDHKPESEAELNRIEEAGGKVVAKMGVPRVVWNRPRIGHKGPVRRSTAIDEIPFLAVARSLGDLWSLNPKNGLFVVSPKPDVGVHVIDTSTFRCLIFGTDGLYNMLSPQMAVHIVQEAERRNEEAALYSPNPHWINPSKTLVERALDRWCNTKMRADNTSVITLMLDPPGPPRAQVLRTQRLEREKQRMKVDSSPKSDLVKVESGNDVVGVSQKTIEVPVVHPEVPKVKPRESTAFDPKVETFSNILNTSSEPETNSSTSTTLPEAIATSIPSPQVISTAVTLPESPARPILPHSSTLSASTPVPEPNPDNTKNKNDIQINEITSSSFGSGDQSSTGEENDDKKKKPVKKMNIIQRKFNLRSGNHDSLELHQQGQDKAKRKEKEVHNRRSIHENVPECSRLMDISPGNISDSRVLRERRNTAPNSNSTNVAALSASKGDKEKGFKKKGIKKKMISTEKKRLLQGLLFNNSKKDSQEGSNIKVKSQPKTKENNEKAPPKPSSSSSKNDHITRSSGRRSERQRAASEQNQVESPREVRKSTLKLRIPDGIFKAKLRGHSKTKLKKKIKTLKNYVGS